MSEMIRGGCPKCGKEIEVPRELEEFSCLYCGARVQMSEMLERLRRLEEHPNGDRALLREKLPGTILNYPEHYNKISKREFFTAFDNYEADNAPILQELELCYMQADDPSAFLGTVCTQLLDEVDGAMQASKEWKHKSKRSQLMFQYKVVMAVFLTPLVRKMELTVAEPFRTELNRQWMERHPDEKWTPGDYTVLSGGFRKGKFCFVTTAICEFEGKPDDCRELTLLREFRDGWLRQCADGPALIERYYNEAPAVVTCIDCCDEPEKRYAELRRRWLTPCIEALEHGDPARCRALYIDMMHTLQTRYYRS